MLWQVLSVKTGPLREMARVVRDIKAGVFRPDMTRSGYFLKPDGSEELLADTEDSSSSSEGSLDEDGPAQPLAKPSLSCTPDPKPLRLA